MKEFLEGFKEGWAKRWAIPPIYADRPSDATLAEGWKTAYQQEKERREEAERTIDMIRAYSNTLLKQEHTARFGTDIRAMLNDNERHN